MNFSKIGHRGAPAYAPENTLLSFDCARRLGADGVEFDLRRTKDRRLIVMHDESLDRTTNGKGLVADTFYEDIRNLDAGCGEKVPTIEEALDFIDASMGCNIELKGNGTAVLLAQIIRRYAYWGPDELLVSSFNLEELEIFHQELPEVRIGLLIDERKNWLPNCRGLGAYSVHPNRSLVDKEFVSKAHANNLTVLVWTVDTPEEIKEMNYLGVDGIISNYPDRL